MSAEQSQYVLHNALRELLKAILDEFSNGDLHRPQKNALSANGAFKNWILMILRVLVEHMGSYGVQLQKVMYTATV